MISKALLNIGSRRSQLSPHVASKLSTLGSFSKGGSNGLIQRKRPESMSAMRMYTLDSFSSSSPSHTWPVKKANTIFNIGKAMQEAPLPHLQHCCLISILARSRIVPVILFSYFNFSYWIMFFLASGLSPPHHSQGFSIQWDHTACTEIYRILRS